MDVTELLQRICKMEECFDFLCHTDPEAIRKDPQLIRMLALLTDYYENGQWLADFEADEQGLIPPDLKRGILSEDGIFNLLQKLEET